MKEPITVAAKLHADPDIERLALALLDVVDHLSESELQELAAMGRRKRVDASGGETAKGSAA